MEKIRDFFHDFTDIFLSVIIVCAMAAVISWTLGNWFEPGPQAASLIEGVVQDNNMPRKETEEADKNNLPEKAETAPEQREQGAESPPAVTAVEIKSITIPAGIPGFGIAEILLENGLINNTSEFIDSAETLNLLHKLKSGTFQIPADATIEEIIKIISK